MTPRRTRARLALVAILGALLPCCGPEPGPQAAARYQQCLREGHGRGACEPLLGRCEASAAHRAHVAAAAR